MMHVEDLVDYGPEDTLDVYFQRCGLLRKSKIAACLRREDAYQEVLRRFQINDDLFQKVCSAHDKADSCLNLLSDRRVLVTDFVHILEELKLIYCLMWIKHPEPVHIISQLPPNVSIMDGNLVILRADVAGFPPPAVQWYKDKRRLPDHISETITIRQAGVYEYLVVEYYSPLKQQRGQPYHMERSTKCAVAVTPNYEIMRQEEEAKKPRIVEQPRGISVVISDHAPPCELSCLATSEDGQAVNYRWYKNGKMLQDTQERMQVPLNDAQHAGMYQCCVSNEHGSVTSNLAMIEVSTVQHPLSGLEATDKVALLIGNGEYREQNEWSNLKATDNDTRDMAIILKKLGFKVVALLNLTRDEILKAVEYFRHLIREGVYALFYYSGHGFQSAKDPGGYPYLAAVDSAADSISAVHSSLILNKMAIGNPDGKGSPALIVAIFDMCRIVIEEEFCETLDKEQPLFETKNFIYLFASVSNTRAFEIQHMNEQQRFLNHSFLMVHLMDFIKDDDDIRVVFNKINDALRQSAESETTSEFAIEQKPEIHISAQGPYRLTDPIIGGDTAGIETENFHRAHRVPSTIVAEFDKFQLSLKFHFELSNVLMVEIIGSDLPQDLQLKLFAANPGVTCVTLKYDYPHVWFATVIEHIQRVVEEVGLSLIVHVYSDSLGIQENQRLSLGDIKFPLISNLGLWPQAVGLAK